MIIRISQLLTLVLACASVAHGQLSTTLRLSKNQYVAGEAVVAVVTITNHAGQDLTFYGDGRMQWLDFNVTDNHNETVTPRGHEMFGKMILRAGETMAREVNLAQIYQLSQPGNFSVSAVVRLPGNTGEGSSTNRVRFNQSPGVPYWTQKVGIPGKPGHTREFRLLNFSGDEKAQIYAQILDGESGENVRTFLLGDVLLLRKPLTAVDRAQRMHVLFLATPTMWVHCQIDTDGKLVDRQIHQRGNQGDPQLLTLKDGSVQIGNSIPYDQKAEAEAKGKIRKASDRPPVTY